MSVTANQQGFTLIEMLVVLVITGMIVGTLFPAIEQLDKIQTQANTLRTDMQNETMIDDWLRQLIQGVQADYPDGKDVFSATSKELSGLTINTLNSDYAGLAAFNVRLRYDAAKDRTLLEYRSAGEVTSLKEWQGRQGRFIYLDAGAGLHDSWPPALGQWPQLPKAVLLQMEIDGAPRVVVAGTSSLPQSRQRLTGFVPGT